MQIHLVRYSTSARSEKVPQIFTDVENFYLLKIHLNLFEIPNQVLKFENLIEI